MAVPSFASSSPVASGRVSPPSPCGPRPPPGAVRRWVAVTLFIFLLLPWFAPGEAVAQEAGFSIVHTWQRIYYGWLDGEERLLFAGAMERLKPALGDLDGDGDPDLLMGGADGRIMYFQNLGSAKAPRWRLVRQEIMEQPPSGGGATGETPIDVGENATPTLVDIDGDGDLDLVVGSARGDLALFTNEGNRFLPIFRMTTPSLLGGKIGKNLTPQFADFNGDAIPDLVLGTADGGIMLLLNQGSRFAPRFCPAPKPILPDCLHPPLKLGSVEPQDNAAPFPVDWDGDGDLDLLVGKTDGKLAYFRNIGNARHGAWELVEPRFFILDAGGYAAPVFADLNGDGRPDLVLAGDGEKVSYYATRVGEQGPEPWLEERNLLKVVRLGRSQSRLHLTSGDWDDDGDADLVVGTRGGQLLLFDNVGGKGSVRFRSHPAPLLATPQRSFATPVLGDIDGDGDLDLLVGDRNGQLEWIRNIGTRKRPKWQVAALHFQNIDVGSFSSPALYDLDGNGALELLVGNSLGNVVLFSNSGTPRVPAFTATTLNFGGLKVDSAASPAFFFHDAKKPPDLVVGSGSGRLHVATHDSGLKISEFGGFRRQTTPWTGVGAPAYSSPHFMDITGDGRPDLLVGGADGSLAAWRYEGSIRRQTVVQGSPTRPSNIVPETESGNFVFPETGLRKGSHPQTVPLDPIFVAERSAIDTLPTGRLSRPAFMDVTGDGRLDLIVGTAAGELLLFHNHGPPENPAWLPAGKHFAGYKHGRNAAPVFYDVDGDSDLDLAVGNEQGRVNYWENTGSNKKPVFVYRPKAMGQVRAGKNAVPAFADLEGDGVPDLLVGNLKGGLLHYRREAGREISFKLVDRRYLELDVGVNSSPTLGTLAGGGNLTLLVGSDRGTITVALPERGGNKGSRWRLNKTFLEGLTMPKASHAALADLDGDGDLDLYVGSEEGRIYFFRNNALVPDPEKAPSSR